MNDHVHVEPGKWTVDEFADKVRDMIKARGSLFVIVMIQSPQNRFEIITPFVDPLIQMGMLGLGQMSVVEMHQRLHQMQSSAEDQEHAIRDGELMGNDEDEPEVIQ